MATDRNGNTLTAGLQVEVHCTATISAVQPDGTLTMTWPTTVTGDMVQATASPGGGRHQGRHHQQQEAPASS